MVEEKQVWEALRNVYDPEIPVNVVDLGLVYNVVVTGDAVRVDMTMTARGCPMHRYMTADARQKLLQVPGVKSAEVNVVWDPPWNPTMMTEAGRKALGWS